MTAENLHETVALAWRQILGHRPDGAEATWDQSGGDSLKALQLFLTLENQLGRKLDPALLSLDMTAGSLADAITLYRHGENKNDKPEIFLFPGIGGYDAQLAEFRQRMAGAFHFTTIAYPGLDAPLDLISSRRAILDVIVKQVRTQSPAQELNLAAYSFGGAIALAAADELRQQGYKIRSLIAIDCVMDEENPLARESVWLSRGIWGKASWRIAYGLFRFAIALQLFQVARRVMLRLRQMRGRHDPLIADWVSLFPFRARPNSSRRLDPGHLPVTLLRAKIQISPCASADLGWGRHTDTLNVIAISGDHRSCLELPNLVENCKAFRDAFFASGMQSDQLIGVNCDAMD